MSAWQGMGGMSSVHGQAVVFCAQGWRGGVPALFPIAALGVVEQRNRSYRCSRLACIQAVNGQVGPVGCFEEV